MFKRNKNSENKLQEEIDVMAALGKLIELEKEKHKVSPIKITI